MNKRNYPPRLEDMAYRQVCNMVREAGVKWTHRLCSAAVTSRNCWLQEIESVEEECLLVRENLASLPVPLISELIVLDSVEEFTQILTLHDNNSDSPQVNRFYNRQIHQDICTHILKAVLLPCLPRYHLDTTESNFVQGILIKLLFVIPNIKILIMAPVQSPNYMQLFVERIQILTHLQVFHFHIGCTTEIIVELSKYCRHMKHLSVQDSRHVYDNCVEHLLKLKQLRSLNVTDTSISNNGYRTLISGLPEIQNVTWFGLIDPVLMNLSSFLPSMRKFVGKISHAELLVRNCPNLTELTLLSLTEDVSNLGELRNVTDITLLLTSCTVARFSTVISRLGQTLTKLELYQVVNINMDDLINYCIVLNSLIISYCHITYRVTYYRKLPHFQNLIELRLRHNWGQFGFSLVFHLYVNLNVLLVVGMEEITDTYIREIVTAGGFRNLTEFVVAHCGYLSMETAWLLMQNCPNLTKLGNINSWPGVANNESATFLNFVKNNNLSLSVYC